MLNGIVANRVEATNIANGPLTSDAAALTANPSTSALLAKPEGRDYFSYIVSCALPAGQTVHATVDGELYQFPGAVGLAPEWTTRALGASEQRWVSACLLARVNAYGISVPISLRGEHGALVVDDAEASSYPLVEGAFYGNVFLGANPIEANACRGAAQAAGETGGLVHRDCTEPGLNGDTLCGLHYSGDCRDFSLETQRHRKLPLFACEQAAGGLYGLCHTDAGLGDWPSETLHQEVITVYVQNQ
ncbi:MAG: hypothetical protein R3B48_17690 [Kofleriaceae bacterium]